MKKRILFILITILLLSGNIYGVESALLITFDTGGGSTVASQSVNAGDKIKIPARPTKNNWVFVGWYTDQTASVYMWDFLNDTAAESMTLYAKWVQVDEKHRLLNAYASAEELKNPYVAATLQTLGTLSEDQRTLTLPEGTTVYVAPGVYWTDLTYKQGFPFDNSGFVIAEPNIGLSILGNNLSFIGLTADPKDAHICGNRGEGGANGLGASGSWYTVVISTGFRGENITIANYSQEDLVYLRDPSQNMPKRINSKNHAEVMRGVGGTLDRIYFENVRFVGFLNMMAGFSPARSYFKNCSIQCTDDAVFGGNINVFEKCTFYFYGNHPSAGGAGAGGINALLGCKVIGMPQMTSTDLSFSKVSRGTGSTASSIYAIIDTEFLGRIETVEWENVVREDARHIVSNNTIGEGKTRLVISPSQPQTSVTLAGAALNAFKVGDEYNIYNLLKGADDWNPSGQDIAKWAPYSNLPYRFLIGATGKTMYSEQTGLNNSAVLTPAPSPESSVDASQTVWSYDTGILNGEVNRSTGVITLTAKPNHTGAIIKTIVAGTLPSGISAGATLYIRPAPVSAPVLTAPAIAVNENFATLSYTLDQPGYKDVSTIEWYRETGPATTNGIHIGTMKNDAAGFFVDDPYREFALNKYDVGYYLRAVIMPKYEFSPANSPITVYTQRAITAADVKETSLYTDFKNLYFTKESNLSTTGRWFFDCVNDSEMSWGWGIGTNGADGIWGLQNNSRIPNTRFVFAQPGKYGNMSLVLNYSPGKVEGQGFGGNGAFLDIYIKYDPATRTGYGLRVERTPASSNATMWTLYQYNDTTQTALTTGLLTCAFMPQSTIVLSVTDNTLRVLASTQSERTPLHMEQDLPNAVDISWTDPSGALSANGFGGFGFRINNSGSSSYIYGGAGTNNCIMIHNVRIDGVERIN